MKRIVTWVCCLAVVQGLLAGCASAPSPRPAPMQAPAEWLAAPASPSAPDDTAAAEAHAARAWWGALQDRELDAWVERAWRDNADAQQLAARLEQARAARDAASVARRPQLDAGAVVAHERVPGSRPRLGPGEPPAAVPAYRQSRLALQLEGRYEADLFGRQALAERAAEAGVLAGEGDLQALRRQLATEVVQSYAELRRAEHEDAAAIAELPLLERLVDAERARRAAGLIAGEPVRQAERQLAERQAQRIAAREQRALAQARLAQLLGAAPVALLVAPQPQWLAQRDVPGKLAPDVPAAVLARRADVSAAWRRVEAASALGERTRLERFPSLTLTANSGFASTALRRWLSGDALAWLVQAAAQVPVLDGGQQQARDRDAAAALADAYSQYRKQVLQAVGDVEAALATLQAAHERVALARAETMRRNAELAASRAALTAGVAGRAALLQAEVAQQQAAAALEAQRYEQLIAWAGTQRALGW